MMRLGYRFAGWLPRLLVVLHDLGMVVLCWVGLQRVRYSMAETQPDIPWLSTEVLIVVAAQGLVFWRVGLYRGLWRFASLPDLWNILRAGVLGVFAIALGLVLFNRFELPVPRSVLVLYPLVLMVLLGTPRMLYRLWKDSRQAAGRSQASTRVLVLGAGRAGEALVRDLRRDSRYHPVGFLDDDRALHGAKVQGVPVLGGLERVAEISREVAAGLLVIAVPTASPEEMQRIVALCEQSRLPFRTIPRLQDVLEGRVAPGELKEVAIEDLLGRDPVSPDWRAMRDWLGGRSVLVTGAGGSIGAELCRQCARLGVGSLTLIELNEFALVSIESELRRDFPALSVRGVLGDCGDPAVCARALGLGKPEAVFHAAAYKQVPLLEGQVREAVRNNVLATEVVARACREAGVDTFVLISTDKAVNPANVLGASKRFAEMVCHVLAEDTPTRFVTVRFGNVLDSAGSVVPLFREQIRRGGPVTVTHPEVTRYFMTIPEACQLILQAAAIGPHEAIYTLDMGRPVLIRQLAEQMIRLAGKQPGRDIHIVYTGLRPGEKLHEVLFHPAEHYQPTAHSKILQAEPREIDSAAVLTGLRIAREAVQRYDEERLMRILHSVVPEFVPGFTKPTVPGKAEVIPLQKGKGT